MNLGFLDKASQVTPLLVRLYDSHKLYGLAKDKKPIARAELTTAISELLEMNLSHREGELIADVLIALLRQAEKDLRMALSERLSIFDNVPLRLILQLANDDIEVAEPVLSRSAVLGDLDLIYIVKSHGPEYWQAIARRHTLSDQVMDILIDTKDFETASVLVQNMNLTLTTHCISVLSELAQGSEEISVPLLQRDVVPAEVAQKLYEYVSQEMKSYIVENYDVDRSLIVGVIDEVVLDFQAEAQDAGEFVPGDEALKTVKRYSEKGLLTSKLMLGALKRGQIKEFIAMFSCFIKLDIETVIEILKQPSGQGLAVVCKAREIVKPDFISIYLLTNRMRNEGRMVDMSDMTRAIQYFESVKPDVARGIMNNSLEK